MTTATKSTTAKSLNLLDALRVIVLDEVPTSDFGRCEPRKDRAKQFRALFKSLGLKGISVRTPSYSMAQSVDVEFPKIDREGHALDQWPHNHEACCGRDGTGEHSEETRCPACARQSEISRRINALLWKAFPNLRDKSDSMTDYFNYCWSID